MSEIKFLVHNGAHVMGWEMLTGGEWHWAKSLKDGSRGVWRIGVFAGTGANRRRFTGLKDKNGVEIYEGDIVRYKPDSEPEQYVLKVEWSERYARFDMTGKYHEYLWALNIGLGSGEVLGNIYENPELLRRNNEN